MRYTSKLITTSAILGAAAGIYAYKQMNIGSSSNNSLGNSGTSGQTQQNTSTAAAGNTSFNSIETKTVTGYTTTPVNTPEGNKPVTELNSASDSNTDTNIKIDIR